MSWTTQSRNTTKSIDEVIFELNRVREESRLRGGTCVCLCEDDREYTPITGVGLEKSQDGAVCLIFIGQPSNDNN